MPHFCRISSRTFQEMQFIMRFDAKRELHAVDNAIDEVEDRDT